MKIIDPVLVPSVSAGVEKINAAEFVEAGCGSVVVGLNPGMEAGGAKILAPASRRQCQEIANQPELVLQAYYWDDLTQDPIRQADWLVHVLQAEGLPIKWIWIDQEQWWTDWSAWQSAVGKIIPTSSVPAGLPGDISAHFENFMQRLHEQIPQCGVFTNRAFISTWAANMDRWLSQYRAWVAHFGWQPVQPTPMSWEQLKANWVPAYDISLSVGQRAELVVGHQFTGGVCILPGTYDQAGRGLPLDLSVFSKAFIDEIRGNELRTTSKPRPAYVDYVVIYKEVNVRAEPSSEAAWVRLARLDEVLHVVKIEDDWALLTDGSYVYAGYLATKRVTAPSDTLPLPPNSSASDIMEYVVLDDRIHVRSAPSTSASVVRFASKGEVLKVLKIENRWARLLDGTFIFADNISKKATSLQDTLSPAQAMYEDYVVTNARVDVLSKPLANSEWVRYALIDEVVQVVKIENDWAELTEGNFVYAEYLKKRG